MQIALPNQSLEETSRGVLRTSGLFLFKTLIAFSIINFIVGVVAQNIRLLSDYLRTCQIFCAISPSLKSVNIKIISALKRKCLEVFVTHYEVSSGFRLGIEICIHSLCKFNLSDFFQNC